MFKNRHRLIMNNISQTIYAVIHLRYYIFIICHTIALSPYLGIRKTKCN